SRRDPRNVIAPRAGPFLAPKRVLDPPLRWRHVFARRRDAQIVAALDPGSGALRRRNRQNVSAVVVGVLTDQVHAAGCGSRYRRHSWSSRRPTASSGFTIRAFGSGPRVAAAIRSIGNFGVRSANKRPFASW